MTARPTIQRISSHDSIRELRSSWFLKRGLGLTPALNRGLAESQAEFIARMDADDVSIKGRLPAQLAFLMRHPTSSPWEHRPSISMRRDEHSEPEHITLWIRRKFAANCLTMAASFVIQRFSRARGFTKVRRLSLRLSTPKTTTSGFV